MESFSTIATVSGIAAFIVMVVNVILSGFEVYSDSTKVCVFFVSFCICVVSCFAVIAFAAKHKPKIFENDSMKTQQFVVEEDVQYVVITKKNKTYTYRVW